MDSIYPRTEHFISDIAVIVEVGNIVQPVALVLIAIPVCMPYSPAVIAERGDARVCDTHPFATYWERVRNMTANSQLDGVVVDAYAKLIQRVAKIK